MGVNNQVLKKLRKSSLVMAEGLVTTFDECHKNQLFFNNLLAIVIMHSEKTSFDVETLYRKRKIYSSLARVLTKPIHYYISTPRQDLKSSQKANIIGDQQTKHYAY